MTLKLSFLEYMLNIERKANFLETNLTVEDFKT